MRIMRIAIVVAFLGLSPVSALAQSPGASESLAEPTTAQMISSSPQPGERGVQGTLGFQWQEGSTNTRGFSINFIGAHTLRNRDLARFDIEYERAQFKPEKATEYVTVENQLKLQQVYLKMLPHRWALMGAAHYRRDTVIKLDYRTSVDLGIGSQFIDHHRVKVLAGATYGFGRQRRSFLPDSTKVTAVGFMDSVVLILSPTAKLEQWMQFNVDTSNSKDKTYTLNTSLISRITRHAGLKVYYQRQYDALHAAVVPKLQQEFGVGMTVSFQPPPPARPGAKP